MKKFIRTLLVVLTILAALVLIGPFLVPVPVLEDVLPVQDLADADSRFTEVDGVAFHYKTEGSSQPALVLLHGFGASLYSWRTVTPDLAQTYTVYAYDRPAFGLTERPTQWTGLNPYSMDAAMAQLDALLDMWGLQQAVLVGNSAGGTVAMNYTLAHPERVKALILVSPAIGEAGGPYARLSWLFKTPQMQRLGPLLVRSISESGLETIDQAWHDPSKQPPDTIPLYTKPLRAENWDVALWNFTTASATSDLPQRLGEFDLPVLVIAGDDDRIVPTASSIDTASKIPGAELVLLPDCGHVPQEECPQIFLDAVENFLSSIERSARRG